MGKGGPGDKVNRQQDQGVGYCFHRGQAHMIWVNGIYDGEVYLGCRRGITEMPVE